MNLPKPPKLGSSLGSTLGNTLKDPTKAGKQGVTVKTPKIKGAPDAFASPSTFFKSEDERPKHISLRNLKSFLDKKREKRAKN